MGIHGIFKEIGPGQRISLAKVSSDHYIAHDRPFRLAIDISIWLFQIQAGKGGTNPALRTFYYRLLRLLNLNIHPLFVFDGPNKPLFKRNKRVGGPGVRVASVPEFLAKQLLKQFGFPLHVAPGEAEAECALLQREGIVDAVLSEDVDTLMFGSGVTLKNWTSENSSSKIPTHVNLYRAEDTKETSGLDSQGMVLVALMSGGDYIPEGIPKCGAKVASDAARAGFGRDLCAIGKKDTAGLQAWKERLQHEIRTNESKFFTRKNNTLTIPVDFPNAEVFGYYTHPCVSNPETLRKLRDSLRWDQDIDFPALREFTAEAFDWRCVGGAKKFIKNLAPAMLVRELRLRSTSHTEDDHDKQQEREQKLISAIHCKRNHATTDGILEYRVSFTPAPFVPIDLSLEKEDDGFVPAGGEDESEAEGEDDVIPSGSDLQQTQDNENPTSPTKKRNFRPYDPDAPEKLWITHTLLQLGCPLLLEDYEASRKAKEASKAGSKARPNKKTKESQKNTLIRYVQVTKRVQHPGREALKEIESGEQNHMCSLINVRKEVATKSFQLPSTQRPQESFPNTFETNIAVVPQDRHLNPSLGTQVLPRDAAQDSQAEAARHGNPRQGRKRPSPELTSPVPTQKNIPAFFSPTPQRARSFEIEPIDLTLSSPPHQGVQSRPQTPTPLRPRPQTAVTTDMDPLPVLPDTVTKRRKKAPLKRWQTEPAYGTLDLTGADALTYPVHAPPRSTMGTTAVDTCGVEIMDLVSSAPASPAGSLPSPGSFIARNSNLPSFFETETAEGGNAIASLHVANADALLGTARRCLPLGDPPSPPNTDGTASLPETQHARLHQLGVSAELANSTIANTESADQIRSTKPTAPTKKKAHIQLRESLAGAWKEVPIDADTLDLTSDGSGWRTSQTGERAVGSTKATSGKCKTGGERWRKSGVEVLDLTSV